MYFLSRTAGAMSQHSVNGCVMTVMRTAAEAQINVDDNRLRIMLTNAMFTIAPA